jgi:hypothetical protein
MLEKETKFFESKLSELQKTEMEKFVVIKDEKILGSFAAITDALKFGYERYKDQAFLVKQILPTQQPLNFANNFLLM